MLWEQWTQQTAPMKGFLLIFSTERLKVSMAMGLVFTLVLLEIPYVIEILSFTSYFTISQL